MRRVGDIFDELASFENLWAAWREMRRGKRRRPSVAGFEVEFDRHLFRIRRGLLSGAWRPGTPRMRLVREPKARLVVAAPVGDRVVHHAAHRLLAPVLDRRLTDRCYACLEGRGTHRALLAFLGAMRRHRQVLLLDMRAYFPSIDRGLLGEVMRRSIKDPRVFALLRRVADSGEGLYADPGLRRVLALPDDLPRPGCGVPIGNLLSQWWGNHYLRAFDHYLERELRVPYTQRYMDDVAIFADDPARLEDVRDAAAEWLWRERRLRLKDPAAAPRDCRVPCVYLGHRVTRAGIERSGPSRRRLVRRLRRVAAGGHHARLERALASLAGQPFG